MSSNRDRNVSLSIKERQRRPPAIARPDLPEAMPMADGQDEAAWDTSWQALYKIVTRFY